MKLAYEDDNDVYLYDPNDGLGDLLTGLILLSFGVGVLTEMFWFSAIWVPLLVPIWGKIKKRLHAGRLASGESAPSDTWGANSKLVMMLGLGGVTLLLGLVFFTLMLEASDMPWLKSWLSTYFVLLMGIIAALLLAAVGVINRAGRFYLYALLALVAFAAAYLFEIHLGIPFTILGALITLSGLVVLSRFLSEYPAKNA